MANNIDQQYQSDPYEEEAAEAAEDEERWQRALGVHGEYLSAAVRLALPSDQEIAYIRADLLQNPYSHDAHKRMTRWYAAHSQQVEKERALAEKEMRRAATEEMVRQSAVNE